MSEKFTRWDAADSLKTEEDLYWNRHLRSVLG